MTPEEFRKYGHVIVDLIADHRATVAERPVMASIAPASDQGAASVLTAAVARVV